MKAWASFCSKKRFVTPRQSFATYCSYGSSGTVNPTFTFSGAYSAISFHGSSHRSTMATSPSARFPSSHARSA